MHQLLSWALFTVRRGRRPLKRASTQGLSCSWAVAKYCRSASSVALVLVLLLNLFTSCVNCCIVILPPLPPPRTPFSLPPLHCRSPAGNGQRRCRSRAWYTPVPRR